jgi:alpha-galactosidase
LTSLRAPWRSFFTLIALLAGYGAASASAVSVVKNGDASIAHDVDAAVWQVTANGTALALRLGENFDLQALSLTTANNRQWIASQDSDGFVTLAGSLAPIGSRDAGMVYESAQSSKQGSGVRLDASFLAAHGALRVTRHYQAMSGSPTFEVWTTFQSLDGSSAAVANLNGFRLTVPAGTVRWLTGLQGDNADIERDSAFSVQSKTLAVGGSLALGSSRRSSETTVPWFLVDGSPDEFYAALLWSGAWSLNVTRGTDALAIDFSLAPMQMLVGVTPVDGPHALFGVARGSVANATSAVRSYIAPGLRNGRALSPLVTYNTWFAYGTRVDEATLLAEMDREARLGTELFVVDAGWYVGAGESGDSDFDSGLGSWQVDTARFPQGLKALTDYAHGLGMKLGLWVEPERVSLATVGLDGLAEEAWLAKAGASYGSDHSALLCLAGTAGRQWVQTQLFALLDAAQPDYVKWDNNLWVNCDREGHGHGATDGNFAQTGGMYQILSAMRARYPKLIVENVSSGGNRLDLGMLRYSDVAWMDDRTAPAVHVRHNVEGLSQLFPPAYLLSFVTDDATEPLHQPRDMALLVRSRMEGVLGLCFRSDTLTDDDLASIRQEIAVYKTIRPTQGDAYGRLLTSQALAKKGPSWDVLQESGPTDVLVFAFQTDAGTKTVNVKPGGLTSATTYQVRSSSGTVLGSFKGSVLASSGIDIVASGSSAHVLIVSPKP